MGGGSSKVYPTIEQAEAPGQAPKPGKKDLRGLELASAKRLKDSEAKLQTEKTALTTERDALIKKRDELQKSKNDLEDMKRELDTKINDMKENQLAIEAALKGDSSKLQEELNKKTDDFEKRLQETKDKHEAEIANSDHAINTQKAAIDALTISKNESQEEVRKLTTSNQDLKKDYDETKAKFDGLKGEMLAQQKAKLQELQEAKDAEYRMLQMTDEVKYDKLFGKFEATKEKMTELENKYRDLMDAFMMDEGTEDGADEAKHMDKLPIALQRFTPLNADPRLKGLKREIDRLTKDANVFARSKRLEEGKTSASEQEQLLNRIAQVVKTPELLAGFVLTKKEYYGKFQETVNEDIPTLESMTTKVKELLKKGYTSYAPEEMSVHEFALSEITLGEAEKAEAILNRCIADKALTQKIKALTQKKLMDWKMKSDAMAVSAQISQMEAAQAPLPPIQAPLPTPAPQSVPASTNSSAVPDPTPSGVAPPAPAPESSDDGSGGLLGSLGIGSHEAVEEVQEVQEQAPPDDAPASPPPSPPALEDESGMLLNVIKVIKIELLEQQLKEDLRLFMLLDLSDSLTVDSTVKSQELLEDKVKNLGTKDREALRKMLNATDANLVDSIKNKHKVEEVYKTIGDAKVEELDPAEKQTILKDLLVETYHDESFQKLLKADELGAIQLKLKTNNATSLAKQVNDVVWLQKQVKALENKTEERALFRAYKRLLDDKKAKTQAANRSRSQEYDVLLTRLMKSLGKPYKPEAYDYEAIATCLKMARKEEADNVANMLNAFEDANKIGVVDSGNMLNVAGWIIEFKKVSSELEKAETQLAKLNKKLNQMMVSGASGIEHQQTQIEKARKDEVELRKKRSKLMKGNPFALLELKVMEVQEIIDHELHARLSQDKVVDQLQKVIYHGNFNFLKVYSSTWDTIQSADTTGVQALKKAIAKLPLELKKATLEQRLGKGAGAAIKYSIGNEVSSDDKERIGVQVTPHAAAGFTALHLDAVNTRMKVTEWLEDSQMPNWQAPAPIKSLMRIAEKVTLKRGEDVDSEPGMFIPYHYDASSVCDVVRDMFECHDFAACAETLNKFIEAERSGKIEIVRFKDRFFENPSPGGWRDIMLNYKMKGSDHICEAQIAHRSLVVARKDLPGHAIYNRVRNASELLEKLFGDYLPDKMTEYVKGLKASLVNKQKFAADYRKVDCGFCAICLQAFHLDPAFLATSWVGAEPKKMKPFKLKPGFEPEIFCMPVKAEVDIARMMLKAGGMELMSDVTRDKECFDVPVLEDAGIEKIDVYANSILRKCKKNKAELAELDGMCFLDAKQIGSPLVDTDFAGLVHLVKKEAALSQITLLSLDGSKLNEESWKGLGDLLMDFMPHLASLWLPNCGINDEGLIAIVKGLSKRTNKIKHFDVSCNQLKITAMQAIANGLSTGLSECEQLVLHQQDESADQDKSLMALAAAISSSKGLKLKNISIDVISEGIGAKMLKKAMASADTPIANLFLA